MKWSELQKALEEIYISNPSSVHDFFKSKEELLLPLRSVPALEPGVYSLPW